MEIVLFDLILAEEVADLAPPQYWHLVVKNGNFTFLLLEFILADQLADLSPHNMQCNASWHVYYRYIIGRHTH